MPSARHNVANIIDRAQHDVTTLLTEAVASRRYDDVQFLAGIAEHIHRLSAKVANDLTTQTYDVSAGERQATSSTNSFPRFARDGSILVKTAQSRGDKDFYEHRAPKSVLEAIARVTPALITKSNRRFTAEALSGALSRSGTNVPAYQVYLCLGWLKRVGVIRQHGRTGYTVADVSTLTANIHTAWDELPKHQGAL